MDTIEKSTRNKFIFISIFFFVVFILELVVRDLLNEQSIIIEKYLQSNYRPLINYFKRAQNIRFLPGLPFTFAISFLLFPLTYSYSFLLSYTSAVYFKSIFKAIYADSRPFLEDRTVFQMCKKGYGNPSGHSLVSTASYFSLAQEIIDFYELSPIPTIIIYTITTLVMLTVNFSRVLLGVHSINQVIFGDCLGFVIFFFVFQILYLHKKDAKKFFSDFLNIKRTIKFSISFVVLFAILVTVHILLAGQDDQYIIKYKTLLAEICPRIDIYRMFNFNSISGGLQVFEYLGMFYGLLLLVYLIKDNYLYKYEYVNNYFHNTKNYVVKYSCLILSLFPLIINWLVPSNANIYIIFIFKKMIPLFFLMFFLYGVNIYFCILFKGGNKNLYDDTLPLDENDYRLMDESKKIE